VNKKKVKKVKGSTNKSNTRKVFTGRAAAAAAAHGERFQFAKRRRPAGRTGSRRVFPANNQ